MTTARQITTALKGRWFGNYGMASCPSHDDGRTPALKISDDPRKSDGIDLHCFAGCSWRTVKANLVRRGTLGGWRPDKSRSSHPNLKFSDHQAGADGEAGHLAAGDNYEAAKEIWQATAPLSDTCPSATYLGSRGIRSPWPHWLRYHGALKHGPTGLMLPALVAGVVDGGGNFVAIHRTFLTPDGTAKAGVSAPKMALGAFQDGAIRLAKAGKVLGLAEGIETGLSAMQLFNIPVWCALGSRLDQVTIPDGVIEVQIFADNGEPGRETAMKAVEALTAAGKRVAMRRPTETFGDWNDALPRWHERSVGDWEF